MAPAALKHRLKHIRRKNMVTMLTYLAMLLAGAAAGIILFLIHVIIQICIDPGGLAL